MKMKMEIADQAQILALYTLDSRFITDDVDSSPAPANPGAQAAPGVRGELGFSIDYRLDTACQQLNEVPDPQ